MRPLLIIVALVVAFTATGQSVRETILSNPTLTRGTYSLYPTQFKEQTAVPKGYKPFYISHYGRHGSRFIQTNEQFDSVVSVLEDAASKDALTELGKEVYGKFIEASRVCQNRAGELTPIGMKQQREIAQRMYRNHPEIFRHNPRISAVSTVVPRVILSMSAFTEGLIRENPKLDITTDTGRRFMKYVNPYSADNDPDLTRRVAEYRFPKAEWSKEWYKFRDKNVDNSRLLASLFKESYIPTIENSMELSMNLFRNAVCFAGTTADVDIEGIFTTEEKYCWWRVINLFYYVEKGNSGIGGGFISDVSDILLKDFIDQAQSVIDAGTRAVTLRFGHDGNVIGLLNSMGVTGWAKRVETFEQVESVACDFTIPMASNIQWIFYRNRAGSVIMKMLHNEEEVLFPVQSDIAPYYRWQDIKEYCNEILKSSTVYKF